MQHLREEELVIQKNLVEQPKTSEQNFQATVKSVADNFNQTMLQGFLMMQNIMSQSPQPGPQINNIHVPLYQEGYYQRCSQQRESTTENNGSYYQEL